MELREVLPTLEDGQARASHRRKHSAYGVGAAVYRSKGTPGRDGLLLSVIVTDTIHGFGEVDISLPRAESLSSEQIEAVERAVEKRAHGGTMQELVGGGAIALAPEEWQGSD